MNQIVKFNLSERKEIYDFFQEQGYVVIRKALPLKKIDTFMNVYQSIRNHPFFIYFSQSLHISMRPKLNQYGFIQQSMLDASRLGFFRRFCKSYQSCIYDDNIADALTILSEEDKHVAWQDMFFDQSTGTVEHQDSWYLDTDPPGKLIGVWYALEDIHPNSGPFFVMPGSHKMDSINRSEFPNHDDYVCEVKKKITESKLSIENKAMTLDKGDILLWHPLLIHGAFNAEDESLSRKSFTSHFYPLKCKTKQAIKKALLPMKNHENPWPTENPRIYAAHRFNQYVNNLIVYALYLKHKLTSGKKRMSMRREDYT